MKEENKNKFWGGFFVSLLLCVIGYFIAIRMYKNESEDDETCTAGAKIGLAISLTIISFIFVLFLIVKIFSK